MPDDADRNTSIHELLDALAAHLPNLPVRVRRAYERQLEATALDSLACRRKREAARVCDGIPLEILTKMSTGSAQGVLAHLTAPGGDLSRRWNEHLHRKM